MVRAFPSHEEILVANSVTLEKREVYIGITLNGTEEFVLLSCTRMGRDNYTICRYDHRSSASFCQNLRIIDDFIENQLQALFVRHSQRLMRSSATLNLRFLKESRRFARRCVVILINSKLTKNLKVENCGLYLVDANHTHIDVQGWVVIPLEIGDLELPSMNQLRSPHEAK